MRILPTLAAALLLLGGQAAFGIPGGCPTEGATPLTIGPLNPQNGFPVWVQDSQGLALELCLDSTPPGSGLPPNCFFDPPIPGDPFSQQIGFGEEAFYWSADTSIATSRIDALLVMAVEAAFLNGPPINGEQFPFTRLRIRIDVPEPGIYTVTHPYGQEQFIVDAVGAGQEIRESFDIEFAPSSTHQGRVGPLLVFDPLADAPLGFVGDGVTEHAVTGSPCGTNFFRIEAVSLDGTTPIDLDGNGNNVVENNLFIVTGKLFDGVVPAPLTVNRTTFARTNPGQVDVFATSASTASVEVQGGPNLNGPHLLAGDGAGHFFASIPVPDASTLPATVDVTATNPGNDPTTIISLLVDRVTITKAEYDANTATLAVEATSSDQLVPGPILTAVGFGNLAGGMGTFNSILIPPPTVTVTSSSGGSDTEPVTIVAGGVGDPPVANPDSYATDEDTPLAVNAANGVLANDTDTEDGTPGTAVLATGVSHGTLVLNADGSFTYTPDANFNGADQFTYAARDSDGNFSTVVAVDITVNPVNDPPVAVNDQAVTDQDTSVDIDVLANDTDIDGDTLTVTAFNNPSALGGTVSCTAAGICTYTPLAGFSSPPNDTFTYTVSDGTATATGTVTVTVNPQLAEVIAVSRALFRQNRNEWVINGTTTVTTPHDMTVTLERTGQVIGTSPVDTLGSWRVRDRNSPVVAQPGDTLRVESSLGAILSGVRVTIR